MSWNGTVTCSYCGARGHNRVTCPERKEYVAHILEEVPEENRSWRQRDILKEDRKYASKRRGPRHCSYCRVRNGDYDSSHNRRNCPVLADDRRKLLDLDKQFRPRILSSLQKHGLGVGAVLTWNDSWRSRPPIQAIITKVHWDSISLLNRFNLHRNENWFTCVDARSRTHYIPMPRLVSEDIFADDNRYRTVVEVFSRAPDQALTRLIPNDWHAGSDKLVTEFLRPMKDGDYEYMGLARWLKGDTNLDKL